jgi:hypothetical protein
MSINMHLVVDDKEVSLWQMPTYVTHMCMTTDESEVKYSLTGKKAKAAISRYLEWINSHDGVFQSDLREMVNEHVRMVRRAITKAKRVYVYAS